MGKKAIGIIGGGNMGEALIKGLYKAKQRVHVCENNPERVKFLKNKYKIFHEQDISSLVAKAGIVIFAVKPQEMESVLDQIKNPTDKLFISIAAGLTTKYFEKRLGNKARVVRAMPNLPALIGKGITGFCSGKYANDKDIEVAGQILAVLGVGGKGGAIQFKESQMDAVTAISGSGPAYVFLFVEVWIDAAKALGFNELQARNLVYETLEGSALLLKNASLTASDFRARVTSKGGTTEAAIKVFLKNQAFSKLMNAAMIAAKKRAKELAK